MSADLSNLQSVVARLEAVASRLEAAGGSKGAAAPAGSAPAVADDPEIAVNFDAYLKEKTGPLVEAAAAVEGDDLKEATGIFLDSLKVLRDIFAATDKCAKPKDTDWAKILAPGTELSQKADKALDNRSPMFHNRKAAKEAMGLMMMVVATSPAAHCQNTFESMDFHAIKVMQKKVPEETEWVKLLKAFISDLKPWCNENCKLGLSWKFEGQNPVEHFSAHPAGSGSAPGGAAKGKGKGKGGGPPPAPKGGAPKPVPSAPSSGGGGGMAEVMNAINNFSVGALKKVTPEMKTKNQPKEEGSSVVKAKAPAPKAAAAATGGRDRKGPRGAPVLELRKQTNWIVENYDPTALDGQSVLELDNVTQQQIVAICNCKNIVVKITTPKVKSICIDSCERVQVLFADVISTVELVNSDRCMVQTTAKVNSFAIDKCNGVNIWLSKESLDARIVTSKSSEMNLTVPEEGGDELDTVEIPIPEQFVTTLVGAKKLKTTVSELYSS